MVGERRGPQPRDRRIGARLRAIRTGRTGYSLEKAAELLGWSLTTMSRMENGQRSISTEEVATVVTAYGLPADERREVIESARSVDAAGLVGSFTAGVPDEMGMLESFASRASALTCWSVALVPGLLQVEAYTLALMRSDGVPVEHARRRWEAWRGRQRILGSVDYTAYLYEAALHVPFGGPAVHDEQLRHLATARDRGIEVRMVRRHVPLAMLSHSWLYMAFPNSSPVVNVEILGGGFYLDAQHAARYTSRITLLDRVALSSKDTTVELRGLLKTVDTVA